jgi:FkbM family methyltransferase
MMRKIIEDISWIPYKIKNKYLYKKSKLLKVKPKGHNFSFPFVVIKDKDFRSLSRNLQAYGIREPRNVYEFVNFIEDEDIVLDVGANIGFFTILSRNAKKIIAIEPIKRCIPILKKNLEKNNLKNVEVFNIALGGGMPLLIEENNAVNLSKIVDKKGENVTEIESKKLEYFVKKYNINFIKIDAEGFEYEIFGKGEIPKGLNKIVMEFHTGLMGKEKSIDLIKNFYKQGFYVAKLIEDLPLRLYPFVDFLWKKMTYVKNNLKEKEAIKEVMKGRSIKYLYFQKEKKK